MKRSEKKWQSPIFPYLEISLLLLATICAKTCFVWLQIRLHHSFPQENSVFRIFSWKNALGQSDGSFLKSQYLVNRRSHFSDFCSDWEFHKWKSSKINFRSLPPSDRLFGSKNAFFSHIFVFFCLNLAKIRKRRSFSEKTMLALLVFLGGSKMALFGPKPPV